MLDLQTAIMYWLLLCTPVFLHSIYRRLTKTTPSPTISTTSKPLPTTTSTSKILQPLQLRNVTLRNRIIRAAAYGGNSIQSMIDTHVEVAKGGVGMTTLAYACVSNDGKTFASQMVLTNLSPKERIGLKQMCKGVHANGALMAIQLTHAGGFANHAVIQEKQKAPSNTFSPSNMSFSKEMSLADLERINNDFVQSAAVAQKLGFDAIELHCGHGYLLSQFLSPSRNQRTDRYGGKPTGTGSRFNYPIQIINNIRKQVGELFPIVVKFNVSDGFNSGLTMEKDVTEFIQACVQSGNVDLLVPSCGYVDQNG